eukprot:TRINITY_DN2049_c0_g1_i1.p1 TRINITY_DN2049_c0_g1~~TRINITY_DN2049_c0_g1_i1.p1  ORF type:complete len:193 (-),score=68.52 TRINITY_DN2049_c0_g1_i1:49-627(-)
MFSLLAGLWRYLTSKTQVNVLILGLDDAGKTTLLEQMKGIFKKVPGIPPAKIPPTIGLNVAKMDIGGVSVTFWDVGGQVRLRALWERYYADAHALVCVMDSADAARFEEAQLAFHAVREQAELHALPLLLLANKQDVAGACSGGDIAAQFDAHKVTGVPFRVHAVSALSGEGVNEGISWLIAKAREKTQGMT